MEILQKVAFWFNLMFGFFSSIKISWREFQKVQIVSKNQKFKNLIWTNYKLERYNVGFNCLLSQKTTRKFRLWIKKIWCASWARVNLPHISNKKCIKIVLQRNLLEKTQGLSFSVEICIAGTVGMSNIKILSVYFCSWTPN
jgi:hypothetical protein